MSAPRCAACGTLKSAKLSRAYYMTFGGSCRRLVMLTKTTFDEFPYDIQQAKKCTKPGKHPHLVIGRKRRSK